VHRFLNAAAMAGLLVRAPEPIAVAPTSQPAMKAASGISELFRYLQHSWVPSG